MNKFWKWVNNRKLWIPMLPIGYMYVFIIIIFNFTNSYWSKGHTAKGEEEEEGIVRAGVVSLTRWWGKGEEESEVFTKSFIFLLVTFFFPLLNVVSLSFVVTMEMLKTIVLNRSSQGLLTGFLVFRGKMSMAYCYTCGVCLRPHNSIVCGYTIPSQGKKWVKSFGNHCMIEQIIKNHMLLLIFVWFFFFFWVQSRSDLDLIQQACVKDLLPKGGWFSHETVLISNGLQ